MGANFNSEVRYPTIARPYVEKNIYYPPEVRRWEYWGLGVFLLQYFPLVKYEDYCIIVA